MTHVYRTPIIPRHNERLAELHQEIAASALWNFIQVGEELARYFGTGEVHTAVWALVASRLPEQDRAQALEQFNELGWRRFLEDEGDRRLDFVNLTQPCREAAEYADQGIAPGEPAEGRATIDSRKSRIQGLVAMVEHSRKADWLLPGGECRFILEAVAARAAIDFGGRASLEGLRVLSRISPPAMRNAVIGGELCPGKDGCVTAEEAQEWLSRRREFCPSRWKDPNDNQWPFDPNQVATPNQQGMIWVPRDADGVPFIPEYVVRPARRTAGISITIGAKGEERQYGDFYQALSALAAMKVARWRRRNAAGNWGIVRARGAWVAISKAEIDQQLEAKLAEAS